MFELLNVFTNKAGNYAFTNKAGNYHLLYELENEHRLSCWTFSPTVKFDSFPCTCTIASYGHLEQKDVPADTNSH